MDNPVNPSTQSICKALYTFNNATSSQSERKAADTFLQSVRESPNGFKISINLFQNTMDPPVLFYCLLVIDYNIDKRYHQMDTEAISMLNQLLLSFISHVCSKDHLFTRIPPHIREKLAQILVKLMKRQYLVSWNSFFKDLVDILKQQQQSDGVWDIFWRILQDLNWSIHENRNQDQDSLTLNMKIKDKMREHDIAQIVEIWFLFLSNSKKHDAKICQQCLQSMDKYIEWIDIKYLSAPRFLSILYPFCEIVTFQNEAVDCLYEIVTKQMSSERKVQLIQSMKIMEMIKKIDIISNQNKGTDADRLQFAESVSGLIEGIGLQLVGCAQDNAPDAINTMYDAYQMALKYFSHPSYTVTQNCSEFLCNFWTLIKRQNDRMKKSQESSPSKPFKYKHHEAPPLNDRQRAIFTQTVALISQNLCYPQDYDVDDPDEAEAEFDDFRKDKMDKLIDSMTRAYPEAMLNLIGNHFSQTCQVICQKETDRNSNNTKIPSWQSIESDLHFMFQIVQHYRPTKNIDELIRTTPALQNLFEYSLKADICTKYPHPMVLLTYLKVVHRYNAFFQSHPEYIAQVLQLFVRCIQQNHDNPNGGGNSSSSSVSSDSGPKRAIGTVRAQAAYLLQKFVSKLYGNQKKAVYQVLQQYVEMLVQSLGSCLQLYIQQTRIGQNSNLNKSDGMNSMNSTNINSKRPQFDSEDVKNIATVLGQLVLLDQKNKSKLYRHCSTVVALFSTELKQYIVHRTEWNAVNPVLVAQIMGQYIGCVQCFFKPFTFNSNSRNDDSKQNIRDILMEFTQIVIQCYSCCPGNDELRSVSMTFVHKAVFLLKEGILNQLDAALRLYIEWMSENNAMFTLQIITNIVGQLRGSFVPTLDLMFYPLFEKTYKILAAFGENVAIDIRNGNGGGDVIGYGQEVASKLEIQKCLYSFLLKVFQSGCVAVLVSNTNAVHFEKVIDCILDGCVIQKGLDIQTHKMCFTILKEMLGAMRNSNPMMKDLYCRRVLKVSFDFAFHRDYDGTKPEFDRTLKTQIFGIHRLMFEVFGNELIGNQIGNYLVSQLNANRKDAQRYCELCLKADRQSARKQKEIVLSVRSLTHFNATKHL